ncbi:MAG TPA: hypothetical protein PKZ37_14910 [Gallionellaceae bacterium]|jgi:transposase-like protein|nr:hypothetical protein [Gallionellaceae bacterium]
MGRKSKLTPEQWIDVERRVLVDGESVSAIAREFGMDEAAIRRKINPNKSEKSERTDKSKPLMQLAKEKVSADKLVRDISEEISGLPVARQNIVSDLARKLSSISDHLAGAAEYGAMTAHRLSMIANMQVAQIDESASLEENADALKSVLAITRAGNEAAQTGLNLLNANKDRNSLSDEEIAAMTVEQIEERLRKG